MLERLQKLIEDFMYREKLNTNKVRLMITNKQPNPLGIAINKVNEIRHKGQLPERRSDLFKLLDHIGAKYKKDDLDNITSLRTTLKKKINEDCNNN